MLLGFLKIGILADYLKKVTKSKMKKRRS